MTFLVVTPARRANDNDRRPRPFRTTYVLVDISRAHHISFADRPMREFKTIRAGTEALPWELTESPVISHLVVVVNDGHQANRYFNLLKQSGVNVRFLEFLIASREDSLAQARQPLSRSLLDWANGSNSLKVALVDRHHDLPAELNTHADQESLVSSRNLHRMDQEVRDWIEDPEAGDYPEPVDRRRAPRRRAGAAHDEPPARRGPGNRDSTPRINHANRQAVVVNNVDGQQAQPTPRRAAPQRGDPNGGYGRALDGVGRIPRRNQDNNPPQEDRVQDDDRNQDLPGGNQVIHEDLQQNNDDQGVAQ